MTLDHSSATRSELRVAVQNAGLGGTWTASATRRDLIDTLTSGRRTLGGRSVDPKGQPLDTGESSGTSGNYTTLAATSSAHAGAGSAIAAAVAASVESAIGALMADALDVERVEAIALQAAQSYCEEAGLHRPLEFPMPDLGKIGKVSGRTVKGFEAIRKTLLVERCALLVGPTGSGKTHAGTQLAEALAVPFYAVSCSGGMSETWLVGRTLGTGAYIPAPFVTCWREGGLFLLDEMGGCPDDVLIILNAALANGILVIPSTGEAIPRNERSYVVAADNTWGRAYSAEYTARSVRDLATANRFVTAQFWIDYDKRLERSLARDILGSSRTEEADTITDCMHALRKGAAAAAVEGWAVSTRQIVNCAKHIAAGSATLRELVDRMMLSLAEEERERIFAEAGPEAKPWESSSESSSSSSETTTTEDGATFIA